MKSLAANSIYRQRSHRTPLLLLATLIGFETFDVCRGVSSSPSASTDKLSSNSPRTWKLRGGSNLENNEDMDDSDLDEYIDFLLAAADNKEMKNPLLKKGLQQLDDSPIMGSEITEAPKANKEYQVALENEGVVELEEEDQDEGLEEADEDENILSDNKSENLDQFVMMEGDAGDPFNEDESELEDKDKEVFAISEKEEISDAVQDDDSILINDYKNEGVDSEFFLGPSAVEDAPLQSDETESSIESSLNANEEAKSSIATDEDVQVESPKPSLWSNIVKRVTKTTEEESKEDKKDREYNMPSYFTESEVHVARDDNTSQLSMAAEEESTILSIETNLGDMESTDECGEEEESATTLNFLNEGRQIESAEPRETIYYLSDPNLSKDRPYLTLERQDSGYDLADDTSMKMGAYPQLSLWQRLTSLVSKTASIVPEEQGIKMEYSTNNSFGHGPGEMGLAEKDSLLTDVITETKEGNTINNGSLWAMRDKYKRGWSSLASFVIQGEKEVVIDGTTNDVNDAKNCEEEPPSHRKDLDFSKIYEKYFETSAFDDKSTQSMESTQIIDREVKTPFVASSPTRRTWGSKLYSAFLSRASSLGRNDKSTQLGLRTDQSTDPTSEDEVSELAEECMPDVDEALSIFNDENISVEKTEDTFTVNYDSFFESEGNIMSIGEESDDSMAVTDAEVMIDSSLTEEKESVLSVDVEDAQEVETESDDLQDVNDPESIEDSSEDQSQGRKWLLTLERPVATEDNETVDTEDLVHKVQERLSLEDISDQTNVDNFAEDAIEEESESPTPERQWVLKLEKEVDLSENQTPDEAILDIERISNSLALERQWVLRLEIETESSEDQVMNDCRPAELTLDSPTLKRRWALKLEKEEDSDQEIQFDFLDEATGFTKPPEPTQRLASTIDEEERLEQDYEDLDASSEIESFSSTEGEALAEEDGDDDIGEYHESEMEEEDQALEESTLSVTMTDEEIYSDVDVTNDVNFEIESSAEEVTEEHTATEVASKPQTSHMADLGSINPFYRFLATHGLEAWQLTIIYLIEWSKVYLYPPVNEIIDWVFRQESPPLFREDNLLMKFIGTRGGFIGIRGGADEEPSDVDITGTKNSSVEDLNEVAPVVEPNRILIRNDVDMPEDASPGLKPEDAFTVNGEEKDKEETRSETKISSVSLSKARPNRLYRYLLGYGRVGHFLIMVSVFGVEWMSTYAPTLASLLDLFNSQVLRGGKRGLREDENSQASHSTGFLDASGSVVRGGKKRKAQTRKDDERALGDLQQIGDTSHARYRFISDAFMKRHGIGSYSRELSMDNSDEGIISKQIYQDSEEESDGDWVVEALTQEEASNDKNSPLDTSFGISYGTDGAAASVGVEFHFGGKRKKRKKRPSISDVAKQTSASAKSRKPSGPRVSDRESGVMGRIRAAGANSLVGRSILGAYPGDVPAPADAADASGMFDLAQKYGYGDWSEDERGEKTRLGNRHRRRRMSTPSRSHRSNVRRRHSSKVGFEFDLSSSSSSIKRVPTSSPRYQAKSELEPEDNMEASKSQKSSKRKKRRARSPLSPDTVNEKAETVVGSAIDVLETAAEEKSKDESFSQQKIRMKRKTPSGLEPSKDSKNNKVVGPAIDLLERSAESRSKDGSPEPK